MIICPLIEELAVLKEASSISLSSFKADIVSLNISSVLFEKEDSFTFLIESRKIINKYYKYEVGQSCVVHILPNGRYFLKF
jgi:hypothetical protein